MNSTPFCGTYATIFLKSTRSISLTSVPPILTLPDVTSKSLGMSCKIVDFPEPVDPIIAVVLPSFAVKETLSMTLFSASPYLKHTSSNSMSYLGAFASSFVVISTGVFKTSSIRPSETAALGIITNTIVIIKNDMIICIEYCMKAIISPTCMPPTEISLPPYHKIATAVIFITNIIVGKRPPIVAIIILDSFFRLVLTSSKRSVS